MKVARRMLADRRRSLLWWSVAMVATVAFTVALWPSVRGQQQFDDLMRDLPEAVRALVGAQEGIPFTSPAGYLHGRLFSTLYPVLVLVFGIGVGGRAVGGAEDDGTLELLLAHPVSRLRVAAERYGAVVGLVVAVTLVGVGALLLLAPLVDLLDGVPLRHLAGATAALASMGLLHASLAFAAGCVFGRRGPAQAVAGAVAIGGYLVHGLVAAAPDARPARLVSPWRWYLERNLLADGVGLQATLLPLVLAGLLVVAGVAVFLRRDLRGA